MEYVLWHDDKEAGRYEGLATASLLAFEMSSMVWGSVHIFKVNGALLLNWERSYRRGKRMFAKAAGR